MISLTANFLIIDRMVFRAKNNTNKSGKYLLEYKTDKLVEDCTETGESWFVEECPIVPKKAKNAICVSLEDYKLIMEELNKRINWEINIDQSYQ